MNPPSVDDVADDFEPLDECQNCGGLGFVAGCFEDTCSGADCDPEDAEMCCAPSKCDWCRGKGGFKHEAPVAPDKRT